jgi:hypothetical protein
VATLAVSRRADLGDAQWAVLEPLLPASTRGRPPKWTKRQLPPPLGTCLDWQRHATRTAASNSARKAPSGRSRSPRSLPAWLWRFDLAPSGRLDLAPARALGQGHEVKG